MDFRLCKRFSHGGRWLPLAVPFSVFWLFFGAFFRVYPTARLLSYFGHSSSSARKLCLKSWVQLRQVSLYVLRPVLGCRKNAHSIFAFLGNLGIVLTSLLLDFCLPFSPNVVPAPPPLSSGVASLISSQGHIAFGRSFDCQGTQEPPTNQLGKIFRFERKTFSDFGFNSLTNQLGNFL